MKKLIKACAVLVAGVLLLCVSVYAIRILSIDLSMSGKVKFTVEGEVDIEIDGKAFTGNALEVSSYSGHTADENYIDTWNTGNIEFDGENPVVYIFTFKNIGADLVDIDFTLPDLSAAANRLELVGQVSIGEEESEAYNGGIITLDEGETAQFTYTLSLKRTFESLPRVNINFNVNMSFNG